MTIPTFDQPHTLKWWKLDQGWRIYCHGIQLLGKSENTLRTNMRRQLTRKLLKEHEGLPVDHDPEPRGEPTYTESIIPEPYNPLSLEIDRYIRRHGGHQKVYDQTGFNISSLRRMSNPFYWNHSVGSIEKLARHVGEPLTVTLTIRPQQPKTGNPHAALPPKGKP